jgi:molecular chaperone GrpE
MTAEHDHTPAVSAVGGPGEPGTAPGPVAAPLPGGVQEPVSAPSAGQGQAPEPAGARSSSDHEHQADGVGVDHERKVEVDLDELVARAEKADHYLELAQRTKADFENYRKRAAREAAAAQERGVAKLALALLPAVDNLDRAVAAADSSAPESGGGGPVEPIGARDGTATLVSGIKLVHADVIAALARVGIEPFSPEGEPFDPQHHEAVAQQPIAGAEPGTVAEVYQRGYRLGETVLRPARVLVAG